VFRQWRDVDRDPAFSAAATLYPDCHVKNQNLDAPLLILIGAKDDMASEKYI